MKLGQNASAISLSDPFFKFECGDIINIGVFPVYICKLISGLKLMMFTLRPYL